MLKHCVNFRDQKKQQKTTLGSTPVSQEQESKAIVGTDSQETGVKPNVIFCCCNSSISRSVFCAF